MRRLSNILIAILIVAVWVGCKARFTSQHGGYASSDVGGNVTTVDYGFYGDHVNFVLFQTEYQNLTNHANLSLMTTSAGYNICEGYVKLPDGTHQDLPTSQRIYEFTHGKFYSSRITFTTSQLRAYLEAHPMPPTIDGLQRFTAAVKRK